MPSAPSDYFWLRYHSGHHGKYGHEFLEFDVELARDGRSASIHYTNDTKYRGDSMIRKTMCISSTMVEEFRRIIKTSEIMKEDDARWPTRNKDGVQELDLTLGNDKISFQTAKLNSIVDVQDSEDPEGLRVFYYLVQDLKTLMFSLMSLHFKIKPIGL